MKLLKYDLYTGMGGSMGGARYNGTYEYSCEADALKDAYNLAVEEYQSYEGCHGILSWKECKEDLIESFGEAEVTDEDADMAYQEQIDGWIVYYVKLHDDLNPPEE